MAQRLVLPLHPTLHRDHQPGVPRYGGAVVTAAAARVSHEWTRVAASGGADGQGGKRPLAEKTGQMRLRLSPAVGQYVRAGMSFRPRSLAGYH
eukprot:scaffold7567_cov104-Isochrysis_galbana.AAC.8